MNRTLQIAVAGLNHQVAPVEVRENIAFTESELRPALRRLSDLRTRRNSGILEAVLLSTCNRTELYALSRFGADIQQTLVGFLAEAREVDPSPFRDRLYTHHNGAAVVHLFTVTAGIDSMMIGEHEILGQVREAYQMAVSHRAAGSILGKLFRESLHVGKRARTETEVGRNAASISTAAVGLAKEIHGDLSRAPVLVVGAGKMGQQTLELLLDSGAVQLTITNRTRRRAEEVAERWGGRVVEFERLPEALASAEIVIASASSPRPFIDRDIVSKAMAERPNRPLFLIDIGVPRNVDPLVLGTPGVVLYNVDDLEGVVEANLELRRAEIPKVEAIVAEEAANFVAWFHSLEVVPTIRAMRQQAEEIRSVELEKALRRLSGLSEWEREVVRSLSAGIVNKMLHRPTVELKAYAQVGKGHLYAAALRNLFRLRDEGKAQGTDRDGARDSGGTR